MTREELNTAIDEVLNNDIADFSLTPAAQAGVHKLIADYIDQEISSAGGGPIITKVVKLNLTAADILSLFTTPKEILPGVEGKVLVLRHVYQKYTHVTTPYTSNTWRIGYNGISFGFVNLTPVIVSASNAESLSPISPSVSASGGSYIGSPLVLGCTTSDPVGGDGTLEIYITYYEIPV